MVNFVFATRGIKRDVDEMVKFLETQPFLLPIFDPTRPNQKFYQPIHGNLQPIQFWSFVAPEYEMDKVLNSLKFNKENEDRWVRDLKTKAMVLGMRKVMGLEKAPEAKTKDTMFMPLPAMENISIIPIGIKYDKYFMHHADGTIHEAL